MLICISQDSHDISATEQSLLFSGRAATLKPLKPSKKKQTAKEIISRLKKEKKGLERCLVSQEIGIHSEHSVHMTNYFHLVQQSHLSQIKEFIDSQTCAYQRKMQIWSEIILQLQQQLRQSSLTAEQNCKKIEELTKKIEERDEQINILKRDQQCLVDLCKTDLLQNSNEVIEILKKGRGEGKRKEEKERERREEEGKKKRGIGGVDNHPYLFNHLPLPSSPSYSHPFCYPVVAKSPSPSPVVPMSPLQSISHRDSEFTEIQLLPKKHSHKLKPPQMKSTQKKLNEHGGKQKSKRRKKEGVGRVSVSCPDLLQFMGNTTTQNSHQLPNQHKDGSWIVHSFSPSGCHNHVPLLNSHPLVFADSSSSPPIKRSSSQMFFDDDFENRPYNSPMKKRKIKEEGKKVGSRTHSLRKRAAHKAKLSPHLKSSNLFKTKRRKNCK